MEQVAELLDPRRSLIKYIAHRDYCLWISGLYIKDLNILGRDLRQTIIVDNSFHSFCYQVYTEE